ncbi:hypothetical protein [Clostridium sp.]|uniref:hypothetical protein n=1 Tax=Clostridium sp. TaxID=1506 RepID=UPI0025BC6179|nr:hypothetical protein [Clostridium sp.]
MAITNNFEKGKLGTAYVPNTYEELGNSIGKVAFQIIREVTAINPLATFSKIPVNNGDTIEQDIIKLVEAQGYDPTGAGALSRDNTEKMAVRLFNNWERHKYKTTVDISKIRKILTDGKGSEEVAQRLVAVLSESDTNDHFQTLKALLTWGRTESNTGLDDQALVNLGSVAKSGTAIDYKGILKKIKDTIKGMQFVNTSFNKAGIKRRTMAEDIRIIMPYTIKNAIDVDELSGVFNLSKAEIESKIIETDTDEHYIYIVDQNAILDFTRLYEMVSQLNADGLFFNYFLHVERLFAISELFDGCFFEYKV